jgi:hypothetical protein
MPTVKERYQAATEYVRRAIATVEEPPLGSDSLGALVDVYAGTIKTDPVRHELERIEARWGRASSAVERERVARDAELLADRTKENLPGAPQDWRRTNLYPGERETSTPPTTYQEDFDRQAPLAWDWLKHKAGEGQDTASVLGKWLLVGGGLLLGYKAISALSRREPPRNRGPVGATPKTLDRALEQMAEATTRNAAAAPGDGGALDGLRQWMVTSAPPPGGDARSQRRWVAGYERMARDAMAALSNRGVISSPADVKAWCEAARRRLRWDNTTEGQGALAFLDALGRHTNQRRGKSSKPVRVSARKAKRSPAKKLKKAQPSHQRHSDGKRHRNATDMTVANTLRDQLGRVTLAMLGASHLVGSSDGLQFFIKGSRKVNLIRIVLSPDDTYTVEFWKGRGVNLRKVAEHNNIYVDQLHEVIAHETGLLTRMVSGARR